MRLPRLLAVAAFVLLAVAALGCSDPVSPRGVSGHYVLVSINGEPLPYTVLQPIPEETITVLNGTVSLDFEGNATVAELRREHPQNNPTETTYTRASRYELDESTISFGFPQPCPINAVCTGTAEGVVTESGLSVNVRSGFLDRPLTYQYRRAIPID